MAFSPYTRASKHLKKYKRILRRQAPHFLTDNHVEKVCVLSPAEDIPVNPVKKNKEDSVHRNQGRSTRQAYHPLVESEKRAD